MFINCKTKSNSLLFLLLLSQLIVPLFAVFTFITKPNNGSVANAPEWKQKGGKWVTEDFGLANQFCLVVCDGVGGSPFNSQYSAKYASSAILNSITQKQLEQVLETDNILTSDSDINDDVATNVYNHFLKYNEIAEQAFKDYVKFLAQNTSDPEHAIMKEKIEEVCLTTENR